MRILKFENLVEMRVRIDDPRSGKIYDLTIAGTIELEASFPGAIVKS
jgi:hypothetical protein